MKTLRLPGFWYCDATPAGAYVAAHYLDAGVQAGSSPTDIRALVAPDAVLQIRISPDGTKYAGGAHDVLNVVEYFDGAAWRSLSEPVTPNCCIFGPDGSLLVADPAVTGSQGYRYLNDAGQPVAAYRTYAPGDPASDLLNAAGITDVWEATIHGDVVVGQGNTTQGAVIRYQGKRHLIESGNTTFIRCARAGSSLSIAIMKTIAVNQYEAVFYWLDMSEIPSLPESYEVAPAAAPKPPAPQPIPAPAPIRPAPAPTPTPVPPAPQGQPTMNPTDGISYTQFLTLRAQVETALKRNPSDYGAGALDAYRLIAEGTPVAIVAAGKSAPTQTPSPNVSYNTIANVFVPMFHGLRVAAKKGATYGDLAEDVFRLFGQERWTLAAMAKDICGTDPSPLF